MSGEQSISPVLGYRDLDAAVKWLCRAFGFEVRKIDREPSGETRFVSLRLGNASVLVSPAADESLANLFVQPSEVNGGNTQSCYLTVENPDQHCARAVAAGATVEFEPQSDYAGDRFYMCRDIEGHLWTFGTGSYGATVDPAMAAKATDKTSR